MFSYHIFLLGLSVVTVTYSYDIVYNSLGFDDPFTENPVYYELLATPEKVDLRVYYEALCPACIEFHTTDLEKVVKTIGPHINLNAYPYGNAKMSQNDGKLTITCQHGPLECYGNKLHACAIEDIGDKLRAELYNSCMMRGSWGGRGSTDLDAMQCGLQMKVNSTGIIACARGDRGEQLLEYYGQQTNLIQKDGVPWTFINGNVFDDDKDFMTEVCKAFKNPPQECMH